MSGGGVELGGFDHEIMRTQSASLGSGSTARNMGLAIAIFPEKCGSFPNGEILVRVQSQTFQIAQSGEIL